MLLSRAAPALLLLGSLSLPAPAPTFAKPPIATDASSWSPTCESSLEAEFDSRDDIQPSPLPSSDWADADGYGLGGPKPTRYAAAAAPEGCDQRTWDEQRILSVVDEIVEMDLNYCHHWIPQWEAPLSLQASGKARCSTKGEGWRGLDCSSFTLWVYNYGLGQRFNWGARAQADGPNAPGTRVPGLDSETISGNEDMLRPGDLIFFRSAKGKNISHVGIWTGMRVGSDVPRSELPKYWRNKAEDGDYIIADSIGIGPRYRPFRGWYKTRFSHARRLID